MLVQVLGGGRPKCDRLAEAVDKAARELGLDYRLEKVTQIDDILAFGVFELPALVIDGEIKTAGRVPSASELKRLLETESLK